MEVVEGLVDGEIQLGLSLIVHRLAGSHATKQLVAPCRAPLLDGSGRVTDPSFHDPK